MRESYVRAWRSIYRVIFDYKHWPDYALDDQMDLVGEAL